MYGRKKKRKEERENQLRETKKEKKDGGSKANYFRSLPNYGDLKWHFLKQIK
ncbi:MULTISPECIES: hypothetical protein [unclassified Methanosarcina]|uniref:hypothetical protein n=1 Tax=unclassified Methanosarcina TaxID=2644672 RepID=UPI000AF188A6|nr:MULTISPECIES: hypothetical protein [unclassified Methanosarcina]